MLSQYRDCATGLTTGVQFPAGAVMGFFFSLLPLQTCCGAYQMGTGGLLLRG